MNRQETTQVNAALRQLLHGHLGKQLETEDYIDLLPAGIKGAYSEDDLYDIVDEYFTFRCEEDGFVVCYAFRQCGTIFKRVTKNGPYKLNDVTCIRFSIGSLFEGRSSIGIIREPRGIHIEIRRAAAPDQKVETAILNDDEFSKVIAVLEKLNVLDWQEYYSSPVLDGTQWDLLLEFPDHAAFASSGSNAYPKGFNALLKELIARGLPEEGESNEEGN